MENSTNRFFTFLFTLLALILFCFPLQARISRIVINKTEPYLDGKSFGGAGSYIRITGQAYGEIDPANPLNSIIQDIALSPVNEKGFVEYISDFVIVRPADMARCNGILFLSLPNRGNAFVADTVLLGRGYVYFWCAWQGDVLAGNNRLTMKVPYASDRGEEISGILRTEYQVQSTAVTLNLGTGFFQGQTHYSYESVTTDNTGLTLTRRIHESDPTDPCSKR